MSDILRQILEASQAASQMQQQQQQQQRSASSGDPIADLLGGILNGGGAAAPSRQPVPQSGGLGVEDLIGMVIGGNASRGEPHHNGAADIISSILGGNRGASSASINPIAQMLAQRLNIPPQIAQAIVAFFMAQMMKRFFGGQQQQQQQPSQSRGGYSPRRGTQQESSDNLDLDDLLDIMGDGNALQSRFSNTGMASDLAKQTGLPEDKANEALQEVVKIIGQQRMKPRPVTTKEVNLKGLLDTW